MKRAKTFKPVQLPITETLPMRIRRRSLEGASFPFQKWRDTAGQPCNNTYGDFWAETVDLSISLKRMGIKRNEHVGIICDNRPEWLRIDMAILSLGAIDVPRGSDTTENEIVYILNHADCQLVFAENEAITERILSRRAELPSLTRICVIQTAPGFSPSQDGDLQIIGYADLLRDGNAASLMERQAIDQEIDLGKSDDVATLIYTSGTTGEPKGVLLPHKSFIFQVDNIYNYLHLHHDDVALAVLPVWHSYERAVEYIILDRNLSIVYSRPLSHILMADLATFKPTIMPAVPRLMESVMQGVYRNVNKSGAVKKALFNFFIAIGGANAHCRNLMHGWLPEFRRRARVLESVIGFIGMCILWVWNFLGYQLVFKAIHKKLGGRFLAAIVGGGAMPKNVDDFFQAIGVGALEGYGLTETGPILAVRPMHKPVLGTIGPIFPDAAFEVRDETGKPLGPGEKGILFVKSIQNMYGYYKKEEETAKVLKDGWLNTGDLAMYSYGDPPFVKILGRIKDTIVLRGGKNVEPEPIEQKLNTNEYIAQSMVVGQDQKFLAALIIPQEEALKEWAQKNRIDFADYPSLVGCEASRKFILELAHDLISKKNGFKPFEQVFRVALIHKQFEVGKELTQSLKLKRHVVNELYAAEIERLFR